MAHSGFSGSLTSPRFDLAVDMGHPFLNRTVDGFIKIGAETSHSTKLSVQLKKMCKEGAYWGTIAGVYVGMEYGIERIRGHRDWKNAMLGGAVTGALVSAASNSHRQNVVKNAITGGAIATAAEFLNYLT
ncbi:outer envelope pore protein 16, chloroplastic-like isoform X2 [Oryza brachyantha]|uniref:outer envelope pore protein 16, chloroplastic-like isoform X2 n=1 Tax=Oryza brachyantha TaxID=4533 RepID=UPI000776A2ED|nr:outer envelope pore protein 16, chloroplastic-like isoform X2 [Oryza brachyantha]